MSSEYYLVQEAVPFFTKRLAAGGNVTFSNGARMFQLLFQAGWEPTKTHYTEIADAIWRMYEREARARTIEPISFSLMPLQTRLPDKRSIPSEPADSMIPVAFFAGKDTYVVPLVCDIDERNNGTTFLDVYFDHSNEEWPYHDERGKEYGEPFECGGTALCEYLLPSAGDVCAETDFDDDLQQFLFDRVSSLALKLGGTSFYSAWGDYLAQLERSSSAYTYYNAALNDLRDKVVRHGELALAVFRTEYRRISDYWMAQNMTDQEKYQRILDHMNAYLPTAVNAAHQQGMRH